MALSQLIINGTFYNGTANWTPILGASLSIVNRNLRITEDGVDASSARAYQTFNTVIGKKYEVKADYIGGTGTGAIYINNNTNFGGALASVTNMPIGTSTFTFTATATTTYFLLGGDNTASYNDYNNLFVSKLTPFNDIIKPADVPTTIFNNPIRTFA